MYVPKRPACLALASAGAVLKSGQRLLLETESEVNTKSAQPHRVLVVGAGLTGSLTAALLRRDWPNENPPLHLTVWERATYPAGRFGAKMTLENDVADLGAQVLSIVDTDSDHTDAGDGGHGISCAAVILAKKEARRLLSSGLLVQAEDGGLGETEERMLWEGIWRHYHAPLGLVSVLKEYLREAKLDCFATERKVESISYVPSQTNLCWGVHASQRSNKTSSSQSSIVNDAFHSVVVCVPAPDALDIQGVKDVFTEDSVEILQGVGYDSRYSIAVFYAYELYSQVARMFNGRSEISLDVDTGSDDAQHGLHLMIFQGAKSGRSTQKYVAIVAHTTPKLGQTNIDAQDLVHRVHNVISHKIGMSESDLQQLTRGSKVIDWKVSQMVRPAESIVTRWKPDVACLTSSEAFSGKVVITGDFLSQSSYLGCLTAALDARDAVLQSASKH